MLRGILLVLMVSAAAMPAQAQEGDVEAGAAVYEENCATCHGERLRPTGAAPDLKTLGADEREKFETRVSEGKGQMPSWEGVLSNDERASLWAYIRSRAR
ncbi:MAG: cytochrome c like protein [Hyphomicrobiales bacterium]|nr:cytochrome c like protein [Hyphomicrobiales bacterium]